MSLLDTLAHWMLPAPAAHVLDVAESMPAAVAAAQAVWNDGRGPLAALAAFSAATENQVDDRAVAQLADWLRSGIATLDTACAAGAWLSGQELAIRGAVDATLAMLFGVSYSLAATRDTLRHWER